MEVWIGKEAVNVVNFHNSCKRLEIESIERIIGQASGRIIWHGDFFTAHCGEERQQMGMGMQRGVNG